MGLRLGIIALVIFGSLERPTSQDVPFEFNDKLMHFGAYWLMTLWFCGSLDRRRYAWLALRLLALGGAIELLQCPMGFGRDADWRDISPIRSASLTALALAYAGSATGWP